MKISASRLLISVLLACGLTAGASLAQTPTPAPAPSPAPAPAPVTPLPAPDPGTNKPSAAKPKAKAKTKPKAKDDAAKFKIQGAVTAVDPKAMTVAIDGGDKEHVLHVNGETRLSRAGNDIRLGDIVVGDYLQGQATKNQRGEDVIVTAKDGPDPNAAGAGAKPKKPKTTPKSKPEEKP